MLSMDDTVGNMEPTMVRMLSVRLVPRASYVARGVRDASAPAPAAAAVKGAVSMDVPYSLTMRDVACALVRETSAPRTAAMRVRGWFGMSAPRTESADAEAARAAAVQLYVEERTGDGDVELAAVPPLTLVEALVPHAEGTHAPLDPELTMYYSQEDAFGCYWLCCAACCAAGAATGVAVANHNNKKKQQQAKPKPKPQPTTTNTYTTNNYNQNHQGGGDYPAEGQYVNNGGYPTEPTYTGNSGYQANYNNNNNNNPNNNNYNYNNNNYGNGAAPQDPYKANTQPNQGGGNYAPNNYGLPPTSQPNQQPPTQPAPRPNYDQVHYGNATSTPAPL